jgi:integrase
VVQCTYRIVKGVVGVKTLEVLEKVLRGKRVKATTQRHYREALGSLSRYSEDWPVSGVVINEWMASLGGFADSTVKMWFDFVNSAGKYMKRTYDVGNPCEFADRPKVSKKRRRYFSAYEIVSIIKACTNDFERALVLTLVDSTCRIGELVNLKGGDVGDGFINVKGKTGERRYRLDLAICAKLREIAGGDDKPVFRNVNGGFYRDSDGLSHRVRYVIERAGIKGAKLGPHTLRHSGASLVAQETGSALAVKALLQHDNIKTSMEYIHDAEDVLQQRISPLRLVGEQVFKDSGFGVAEKTKQLTMGGEIIDVGVSEFKEVEAEVSEGVLDLLDEQFPEISEGVEVRPLLKTEDLRLIRRVFMRDIRSGLAGSDELRCKELVKRVLRRVKVKLVK